MCTAICTSLKSSYLGRTLDVDYSYREKCVIIPRNYNLNFLHGGTVSHHSAIVGTAAEIDGVPLLYDGMNEEGLSVAALDFSGIASYKSVSETSLSLASFELIPYILSSFKSTKEAVEGLKHLVITDEGFSENLPPAPLHWILYDGKSCACIEPLSCGVKIFANAAGVMTNAPELPYHIKNLSNYMHLSPKPAKNSFAPEIEINAYSAGYSAIGLPGDSSSASRFVRAVYNKSNILTRGDMLSELNGSFHLLNSVEQICGCTISERERPVSTLYSVVYDLNEGMCFYKSYKNSRIRAVKIDAGVENATEPVFYPIYSEEDVLYLN